MTLWTVFFLEANKFCIYSVADGAKDCSVSMTSVSNVACKVKLVNLETSTNCFINKVSLYGNRKNDVVK